MMGLGGGGGSNDDEEEESVGVPPGAPTLGDFGGGSTEESATKSLRRYYSERWRRGR